MTVIFHSEAYTGRTDNGLRQAHKRTKALNWRLLIMIAANTAVWGGLIALVT